MFKGVRPLALAGLMTASLACGLQQGSPGTQPQQATGALPQHDTGTQQRGGTLRLPVSVDPYDWDLSYGGIGAANTSGLALAYSNLLNFRAGPDVPYPDNIMEPGLAERWEVSPDARQFTFYLRKGVKFANLPPLNGREFTSADVKWTFEYYSRTGEFKDKKLPRSPIDWIYEGIDTVETPDPYSVVVRFKDPFASFLGNTAADRWSPIAPKDIYEQDGHLKERMVGTGPFQLDQTASQKGSRWVFKKHPAYFREGLPYIDEVRWLVIPDDATSYAAFQAKQLDLLTGDISVEIAESLKKNNPTAVMYRYQEPAPLQLFFNVKRPPLDDIRVRKAMALSINRDEFIKTFAGGEGRWALAAAIAGLFTEQEVKQIIRHDPEEAKRLLREAGFGDGINLEFMYTPSRGDGYISEMELLIAQLKRTGINVTAKSTDRAADQQRKQTGDFEITMVSNARFAGDVGDWAIATFTPSTPQNFNQVDDPRLGAMLKALRSETNQASRRERVREIARFLYDNVLGLAIYHGVGHSFWHPYLKNYAPNYWKRGTPIVESWLEK